MNAPQVLATLRVLARRFGSDSKEHTPGTVDHEVTETVAVALAKLAIELEHEHRIEPGEATTIEVIDGDRIMTLTIGVASMTPQPWRPFLKEPGE